MICDLDFNHIHKQLKTAQSLEGLKVGPISCDGKRRWKGSDIPQVCWQVFSQILLYLLLSVKPNIRKCWITGHKSQIVVVKSLGLFRERLELMEKNTPITWTKINLMSYCRRLEILLLRTYFYMMSFPESRNALMYNVLLVNHSH